MAYESLAMISSALSRLECGQLGVMRSVSINVVHLLLCIYKQCTCFCVITVLYHHDVVMVSWHGIIVVLWWCCVTMVLCHDGVVVVQVW